MTRFISLPNPGPSHSELQQIAKYTLKSSVTVKRKHLTLQNHFKVVGGCIKTNGDRRRCCSVRMCQLVPNLIISARQREILVTGIPYCINLYYHAQGQ